MIGAPAQAGFFGENHNQDRSTRVVGEDRTGGIDGASVEPVKHGGGKASRVVAVRLIAPCAGSMVGEPYAQGKGRSLSATCAREVVPCEEGREGYLMWRFTGPPGVAEPTPLQWRYAGTACVSERQARAARGGADITAAVLREVAEIEWEPAGLAIQPDSPRVLVTMPVNLMAHAKTQDHPVEVLGTAVQVRARPFDFRWEFEPVRDPQTGEEPKDWPYPLVTTDPGAPYPDMWVKQVIEYKGRYRIHLRTRYSVEFRLPGGAWQAVPGLAQADSTPRDILAVETRAHLYAGDDRKP